MVIDLSSSASQLNISQCSIIIHFCFLLDETASHWLKADSSPFIPHKTDYISWHSSRSWGILGKDMDLYMLPCNSSLMLLKTESKLTIGDDPYKVAAHSAKRRKISVKFWKGWIMAVRNLTAHRSKPVDNWILILLLAKLRQRVWSVSCQATRIFRLSFPSKNSATLPTPRSEFKRRVVLQTASFWWWW